MLRGFKIPILSRATFLRLPIYSKFRSYRYYSASTATWISEVKSQLDHSTDETGASDIVISALDALKKRNSQYSIQDLLDPESTATKEGATLIEEVLSDKNLLFTPDLLKLIFLVKLPTLLSIKAIQIYYTRNPTAIISREVALIALRKAIWDAQFSDAIKLSDMTVGHPNYIKHKDTLMKSGLAKLAGTTVAVTLFTKFGIQHLIEIGDLLQGWRHMGSIGGMIIMYAVNVGFFLSIVNLGRQAVRAGGDYLTWQKGTFYTNWFRYADEMLFSAQIIEADRALNEGESNPAIIEELCRPGDDSMVSAKHTLQPGYNRDGKKVRLLEAKDNLEDLKMQAYWMKGGDGFQWVEPDQDPAILLWRDHLKNYQKPFISNSGEHTMQLAEDLMGDKE